MTYPKWMDKTANFKTIDVRGIQGNFFQGIKNMESKGKSRAEIAEVLKERFGEKNPDVKVM